jgi:hypothetical protein
MRRLACLFFLTLFPLAGSANCSPGAPEPFARFLPDFLASGNFALSRTAIPLRSVRWEYGIDAEGHEQEKKTVTQLGRQQISRDKSLDDFMRENGLQHKLLKLARDSAEVQIYKPDTDWLLHYHFRLHRGCWQLREVEDFSL